MPRNNIFFIMLSLVILCGCGYTTSSVVAKDDVSICIDNFVNKINITREISDKEAYYAYRPGMESDITREVIDKFIVDGNYKVSTDKNVHFLLKGQLVDFKREPLRYDANDNVIEYRIRIVVDIELYDLKKEKVVWQESSFAGESTYRTTHQFAKSENVAAQDATKDLATRIVERTVEDW